MSGVLETAKAHFIKKVNGTLNSVEVPEWETTIYFKPMNLEQKNIIYSAYKEKGLEMYVKTLVVRALDSDGKRMFKGVDALEIRKLVDPNVIERICIAMESHEEDIDDKTLKNS